MPASYRFVARGRVQGVGFRQATANQAQRLAIGGWVRNREDGGVEGLACSTNAAALTEFRRWLERGPPSAHVDQLQWELAEMATETTAPGVFKIRR